MKVFLGWSGDRSKSLAEALRDWLPLVLQYVEPWMSTGDIAAGERWSAELATELEASNFGIISVTPENVSEPWILFEAGSLAKSLQESKVVPLLLNLELSDVTGPLGQFQAKKAERDGIRAVVESINKSASEPLDDVRKNQLFDALWSAFQDKLSAIPEQQHSTKPKRATHEVLEELVASVRSFDSRLRSIEELADRGDLRSRRGRRIHPMMFEELMHMTGRERADPTALILFASVIRDDAPWLYEMLMDTYREANFGGRRAAKAYHRLLEFVDMTRHHPIMEELMMSKEMHSFVRELQRFLHEVQEVHPEALPKRSSVK